jgi:hypothetical protein
MIQKLKNKLVILASLIMIAAPFGMPVAASAAVSSTDINEGICAGSNFNVGGNGGGCNDSGTQDNLNKLLTKIINIISAIVGVVAVIMIIYGGFKYITSGGDSNNVSGAKNTIIYAIIGLVIVALAQLIVHFVLNTSSGLN